LGPADAATAVGPADAATAVGPADAATAVGSADAAGGSTPELAGTRAAATGATAGCPDPERQGLAAADRLPA